MEQNNELSSSDDDDSAVGLDSQFGRKLKRSVESPTEATPAKRAKNDFTVTYPGDIDDPKSSHVVAVFEISDINELLDIEPMSESWSSTLINEENEESTCTVEDCRHNNAKNGEENNNSTTKTGIFQQIIETVNNDPSTSKNNVRESMTEFKVPNPVGPLKPRRTKRNLRNKKRLMNSFVKRRKVLKRQNGLQRKVNSHRKQNKIQPTTLQNSSIIVINISDTSSSDSSVYSASSNSSKSIVPIKSTNSSKKLTGSHKMSSIYSTAANHSKRSGGNHPKRSGSNHSKINSGSSSHSEKSADNSTVKLSVPKSNKSKNSVSSSSSKTSGYCFSMKSSKANESSSLNSIESTINPSSRLSNSSKSFVGSNNYNMEIIVLSDDDSKPKTDVNRITSTMVANAISAAATARILDDSIRKVTVGFVKLFSKNSDDDIATLEENDNDLVASGRFEIEDTLKTTKNSDGSSKLELHMNIVTTIFNKDHSDDTSKTDRKINHDPSQPYTPNIDDHTYNKCDISPDSNLPSTSKNLDQTNNDQTTNYDLNKPSTSKSCDLLNNNSQLNSNSQPSTFKNHRNNGRIIIQDFNQPSTSKDVLTMPSTSRCYNNSYMNLAATENSRQQNASVDDLADPECINEFSQSEPSGAFQQIQSAVGMWMKQCIDPVPGNRPPEERDYVYEKVLQALSQKLRHLYNNCYDILRNKQIKIIVPITQHPDSDNFTPIITLSANNTVEHLMFKGSDSSNSDYSAPEMNESSDTDAAETDHSQSRRNKNNINNETNQCNAEEVDDVEKNDQLIENNKAVDTNLTMDETNLSDILADPTEIGDDDTISIQSTQEQKSSQNGCNNLSCDSDIEKISVVNSSDRIKIKSENSCPSDDKTQYESDNISSLSIYFREQNYAEGGYNIREENSYQVDINDHSTSIVENEEVRDEILNRTTKNKEYSLNQVSNNVGIPNDDTGSNICIADEKLQCEINQFNKFITSNNFRNTEDDNNHLRLPVIEDSEDDEMNQINGILNQRGSDTTSTTILNLEETVQMNNEEMKNDLHEFCCSDNIYFPHDYAINLSSNHVHISNNVEIENPCNSISMQNSSENNSINQSDCETVILDEQSDTLYSSSQELLRLPFSTQQASEHPIQKPLSPILFNAIQEPFSSSVLSNNSSEIQHFATTHESNASIAANQNAQSYSQYSTTAQSDIWNSTTTTTTNTTTTSDQFENRDGNEWALSDSENSEPNNDTEDNEIVRGMSQTLFSLGRETYEERIHEMFGNYLIYLQNLQDNRVRETVFQQSTMRDSHRSLWLRQQHQLETLRSHTIQRRNAVERPVTRSITQARSIQNNVSQVPYVSQQIPPLPLQEHPEAPSELNSLQSIPQPPQAEILDLRVPRLLQANSEPVGVQPVLNQSQSPETLTMPQNNSLEDNILDLRRRLITQEMWQPGLIRLQFHNRNQESDNIDPSVLNNASNANANTNLNESFAAAQERSPTMNSQYWNEAPREMRLIRTGILMEILARTRAVAENIYQDFESDDDVDLNSSIPLQDLVNNTTVLFRYNGLTQEERCTICLTDYATNETLRRLPCFHTYHRNCIDRWLNRERRSCPNCRTYLSSHLPYTQSNRTT